MSKEQTESKEQKTSEEQTALVATGTDEFALEKNRALEIAERFLPNIDATKALNEEFQKVVAKEINEKTVKEAKMLRLKFVKLRTGTDKIHKTVKNSFLNGCRFVDSCKSVQRLNGEPCETKLKKIETHFETMRQEAVLKLQGEREVCLVEFGVEVFPSLLGEMEQEVWDNYINGVELNFEAKKKEAADAEALRLKNEEEAKAETERIRLENEQLKKDADKVKADAKKEQEKREAKEKEAQDARDAAAAKLAAEEKAKNDAKDAKDSERADKLLPFLKYIRDYQALMDLDDDAFNLELESLSNEAIAEANLLAEQEQKRKDDAEVQRKANVKRVADKQKETDKRKALEAELKATKDAEELAEKQKEAARQAELSKGDDDKVVDLITAFLEIKDGFEFDSDKNKKLFKNVCALCDKVITYIEEQTK